MDTGERTTYQYYGGDAYSGIQHASADAANNVTALAKIARTGFSNVGEGVKDIISNIRTCGFALLLVAGLGFISVSGYRLSKANADEQNGKELLALLNDIKISLAQKGEICDQTEAERGAEAEAVDTVEEAGAKPIAEETEAERKEEEEA